MQAQFVYPASVANTLAYNIPDYSQTHDMELYVEFTDIIGVREVAKLVQ